jgi:S-adenosylmethionine-diacylglycerol 3-amino-3-carboxypropyl transferase
VVREDPNIEIALINKFKVQNPLMVGSGGCTALAVASVFPGMRLCLIEPNIHQIALIKSKVAALQRNKRASIEESFSIERIDKKNSSFIECGNFESLFKQFRAFLHEFVATDTNLRYMIQKKSPAAWKRVFQNPYWSVAFDLFFSDSMLRAMFGPTAVQHGQAGSYPNHFRQVIEQGLTKNDGHNYFLHHIFLGHYLRKKSSLPVYLQHVPDIFNVQYLNSTAVDVYSYEAYDFVSLSNIFDWSNESEIRLVANKLVSELRPGSVLVFRQLNNTKSFIKFFGNHLVWQKTLEKKLLSKDRSMFYSSLHIGVKV